MQLPGFLPGIHHPERHNCFFGITFAWILSNLKSSAEIDREQVSCNIKFCIVYFRFDLIQDGNICSQDGPVKIMHFPVLFITICIVERPFGIQSDFYGTSGIWDRPGRASVFLYSSILFFNVRASPADPSCELPIKYVLACHNCLFVLHLLNLSLCFIALCSMRSVIL